MTIIIMVKNTNIADTCLTICASNRIRTRTPVRHGSVIDRARAAILTTASPTQVYYIQNHIILCRKKKNNRRILV